MYFLAISACLVFTSVAVPIHVNASAKLDSPKDRLRNPFDYALPAQNPQSSSDQLLTAKLAQQPSAQLANWQIAELILVGTIARAGVFQGLVKDPRNMIHVISAGDIVTKARFKVFAVKPEAVLLFSEPSEPSEPSELSDSSQQLERSKFTGQKKALEQSKQPGDRRDAWVSLKLRPDVTPSKGEH